MTNTPTDAVVSAKKFLDQGFTPLIYSGPQIGIHHELNKHIGVLCIIDVTHYTIKSELRQDLTGYVDQATDERDTIIIVGADSAGYDVVRELHRMASHGVLTKEGKKLKLVFIAYDDRNGISDIKGSLFESYGIVSLYAVPRRAHTDREKIAEIQYLLRRKHLQSAEETLTSIERALEGEIFSERG